MTSSVTLKRLRSREPSGRHRRGLRARLACLPAKLWYDLLTEQAQRGLRLRSREQAAIGQHEIPDATGLEQRDVCGHPVWGADQGFVRLRVRRRGISRPWQR